MSSKLASPPGDGMLIVIEGIDGSGKTTLQARLAMALRQTSNGDVVETKEPTDGPIGQNIRALANSGHNAISPNDEFEMFLADRREHVQAVVLPALRRGAIVVQDRSYFSTIAYQGTRGLDEVYILDKCREVAPAPDLLLVLDVPAKTAIQRIVAKRGKADEFETFSELVRVREVFRSFPGAKLIDATHSADRVFSEALVHVYRTQERRILNRKR